jgi:membrane protein DedA with SNARE-associated domain/membrane-associated phospholipid phosphatase
MEIWHIIVLFLSHAWTAVTHVFMHAWFWVKHYIEAHPDQILLIATIVAFLEALPVVGTIFPGSVTMTLVGIFAGRGLVSIGETVLWTTVGALMGDWIGFWFGRHFREKIPRYWPFKNKPNWLANGRKFFEKHGGKSIILGRFIGPARSTVPMIAGVFGMTAGRFGLAAVFSAFFWSIAYLIPGILIGAVSLQLTPKETTFFLVTGLLVVVCLWFLFWLIQRCFQWLARLSHCLLGRCWHRLLVNRVTGRIARWLAIPADHQDSSPLERIVWLVLCLVVFVCLFVAVLIQNSVIDINVPAFYLFQSLRNPGLDAFFSAVTLTGAPKALFFLMVVVAIWYAVQKDWQRLIFWLLGMGMIGGAVMLLKFGVYEPRPIGFNYQSHTSGFPSGHTALSTVAYGLLAFWTTTQMRMGWRSAWRIIAVLWVFLIGVSRLYLGAHWLWDVVAGWSLATADWLLITLLYRRTELGLKQKFVRYSPWVVLLLIVVVSGGYVWKNYHRELYRTTPLWEQRTETLAQWIKHPHRHIPQFLNNRLGKAYLPMNIQWVGNVTCVRKQLRKMGWSKAGAAWDIKNLIKRLTLKRAENHLPIFNRRFEGKLPDIIYIKAANKPASVLELYLWTSAVQIQGTHAHVLVGFINQRNASDVFKHVDQVRKTQYHNGDLAAQFAQKLAPHYRYKKIISPQAAVDYRNQGWGGDTWLVYPAIMSKKGSQLCP